MGKAKILIFMMVLSLALPALAQNDWFVGFLGSASLGGKYEKWHYQGAMSEKYDLTVGGNLQFGRKLSERLMLRLDFGILVEAYKTKSNRPPSEASVSSRSIVYMPSLDVLFYMSSAKPVRIFGSAGMGYVNRDKHLSAKLGIGSQISLTKDGKSAVQIEIDAVTAVLETFDPFSCYKLSAGYVLFF